MEKTSFISAGTKLPLYLPFPNYLLQLDISQTARVLYALLLNRSTLSQKNEWVDERGRIFIVFPIEELAKEMRKGKTTIKAALNELSEAGLLERIRTDFGRANHLYVKILLGQDGDGYSTVAKSENKTSMSRKSKPTTGGYSATNNCTKTNYNSNKRDIRTMDYTCEKGESL